LTRGTKFCTERHSGVVTKDRGARKWVNIGCAFSANHQTDEMYATLTLHFVCVDNKMVNYRKQIAGQHSSRSSGLNIRSWVTKFPPRED